MTMSNGTWHRLGDFSVLGTRRACQGRSTDTQGEDEAEGWAQHSEGAQRSPPSVLYIANEPG